MKNPSLLETVFSAGTVTTFFALQGIAYSAGRECHYALSKLEGVQNYAMDGFMHLVAIFPGTPGVAPVLPLIAIVLLIYSPFFVDSITNKRNDVLDLGHIAAVGGFFLSGFFLTPNWKPILVLGPMVAVAWMMHEIGGIRTDAWIRRKPVPMVLALIMICASTIVGTYASYGDGIEDRLANSVPCT